MQYGRCHYKKTTPKEEAHEDKVLKGVIYEPRREVSEQINPADTLISNT